MEILLREATETDLALIMSWRSNPDIYQGFYSQKAPLVWEEHLRWWESRNKNWHQFVIVLNEDTHFRDVGLVVIAQTDNWNPEIGIFVGEVSLWGKGIGKAAIGLALQWLRKRGYSHTHTTIKDDNKRSIKLFTILGFQRVCEARKGESRYEKVL